MFWYVSVHLSVCPQEGGGGRYLPQARSGGRYPKVPTPSQVRGGGTPRYLLPGLVTMGEGVPQGTYPQPGQDRGGATPRYLPPLYRSGEGRGYPKVPTPFRAKDLLQGGRYSSCVHAGGLSCCYCFHLTKLNLSNVLLNWNLKYSL